MSTEPTKIGKYRIVRELGRGNSSRVYLGRDPFADRTVAIKVMLKESESGNVPGSRLERIFNNEASLAGRLIHPHIIEILDADVGKELGYIVMEYVDGRTLEHFCKVDTLMPLNSVVELAFKCGLALDFASRKGIIHRDIKPANILMGNNGDVKLSDFGIALRDDGESTQLQGVGSPTYMSPEQIQEEPLTHQTDIYSLGVVMYRLLTGKLPFVASNNTSLAYQVVNVDPVAPSVHRPDLSGELDRIVMKAIAKDLSQRYQSWNDFAQDLGKVNKDLSLSTDTITETEKFSAIQKVRYFSEFGELEIWEMVRIATFRRVQPKETIVPEGEVCDSFFLIVGGEARVRKAGKSLSVLGDGDCFGEMPYFEERGPRTSSVVAITPITVIEVNSTALRLASDACQKQFNRGFLRILLDRIDRLSKANLQLVQSTRFKPESSESTVSESGNPVSNGAQPKAPESKGPESTGAQPTAPQPKAPQPTAPQPTAPQPTATQPMAPQQKAPQPTATQPTATQPMATQPRAPQPTATQQTATQPMATQPRAPQPTATQQTATQPTATQPTAPQQTATQPTATQQTATQPTAPQPRARQPMAPEAGKADPKKPETIDLKIELPELKKSVSDELKIEFPDAKKPEPKELKIEYPESKKPESKKPESKKPESKPPESQGLKLQDPEAKKSEPQGLKLEAPQSKKPESKPPESQGLKLQDPEAKKSEPQGLKLQDPKPKNSEPQGLKLEAPQSKKPVAKPPESQGLRLQDPEPRKSEPQGLKIEAQDSRKPESKPSESQGLKLQDPEPKKSESQGLKLEAQ